MIGTVLQFESILDTVPKIAVLFYVAMITSFVLYYFTKKQTEKTALMHKKQQRIYDMKGEFLDNIDYLSSEMYDVKSFEQLDDEQKKAVVRLVQDSSFANDSSDFTIVLQIDGGEITDFDQGDNNE